MSYLIYGYAKPKTTCSYRDMKLYFVISIIMALGLLEIFIKILNFSEVTSFLWCVYMPVSLSLFYLILNTMCKRGKRALNIIL